MYILDEGYILFSSILLPITSKDGTFDLKKTSAWVSIQSGPGMKSTAC